MINESVALAKDTDTKKESSPTHSSDETIHRFRNEPERQFGSLRGVIGNIRRDGGKPSVDSIATELSSMLSTAQRAPVLLALQHTHGNRYVQRVVSGIQAKLKIGQPNDIYEQEADRVADEVMRMPEPGCSDCEEEKKLIMAKAISGKTPEASDVLQTRLKQRKGGGQPLSQHLRAFFEQRFGYDFSQVRVHFDSRAAEMAETLNARAFTVGQDMVFGAGQYNPRTEKGQRFLAHELTHVVQQRREILSPLGYGARSDQGDIAYEVVPNNSLIQKEEGEPEEEEGAEIRQEQQEINVALYEQNRAHMHQGL